MTLQKVIKTRASFPNEEAALKLLYLALKNVAKKWKPSPNWRTALNHFMLLWGDPDRSCPNATDKVATQRGPDRMKQARRLRCEVY